MDIVPETINRIRLSNDELILLHKILNKLDITALNQDEDRFIRILKGRIEGRLNLKKNNRDLWKRNKKKLV